MQTAVPQHPSFVVVELCFTAAGYDAVLTASSNQSEPPDFGSRKDEPAGESGVHDKFALPQFTIRIHYGDGYPSLQPAVGVPRHRTRDHMDMGLVATLGCAR